MKRLFLYLLFLSMILPGVIFAGNTGSIKGKVLDNEGKPVVGASVRVIGTRLGGFVKADGHYAVTAIPAGDYTVKITAVGFQATEIKVKVSADNITITDVKMQVEGFTTPEVVVHGDALVNNTKIGISRDINTDGLQHIGREGLQALVGLSAGVFNTGNGFIIRGARENESQIRVDGADVGNQFTGGFGSSGATLYPMISSFAVQEVQVITGGLAAEYGNALGGIVNSSAKTGRNDSYEGFLRWRTDVPALWGSQTAGIKLVRDGDRYKAVDYGNGPQLQGDRENTIEGGAGGPIPFLDKSTFYLSTRYYVQQYRSASYEIYDPVHIDANGIKSQNNLGLIPHNESYVKNITGRLKFAVTNDIDFVVGGSFGMTNAESNGWGWIYATDPGSVAGLPTYGVPENLAKQIVLNQLVTNILAKVSQRFSPTSFYEFNISNTSNNDENAKRLNFNSPSYFSGYDLWYPVDNVNFNNGIMYKGRNKVIDNYEPISIITRTKDLYYLADLPQVNPLTGYIEGAGSASTGRNAYGLVGYFDAHGDGGFQFRRGNYWQFDGNYNLLAEDKEFTHAFKAGFETRLYTVKRHYNGLPWDDNPFYDVYTNDWGGDLYNYDNPAVAAKTSKAFNPVSVSAFIQDQITYKGIILTPGLRYDMFMPNAKTRTILDPYQGIQVDSAFTDASVKTQISPRMNVTYPITLTSNIMISYGLMFMMPQMQYLYDGFNTYQLRGNSILGNTDIKAQRVNAYSLTYNNALTDDFALDISAYYRDVYNQLGISYVQTVPNPYYIYTIADYGNTKGLEITFRKRPTNHFGFNINYNLSQSVATSPDPGSNYNLQPDPFTGKYAVPLAEIPTSSDRRHRINVILDFMWDRDEGPSIAGIKPLENVNINLTGFFQSGLPYTRLNKAGTAIGEENAERQPSMWNTNFRISKGFSTKSLGMGEKSEIEFFVDINNIFNVRNAVGVYSRSGDPLDDGVNFYKPITDFSPVVYYRDANYGRVESISTDQYSQYGERFYNVNGDHGNKGTVTQMDKFISFTQYLENIVQFRGNFLAPITVYVGLLFKF